jgi:cytochrome c oxidase subunit 2
MDMWAASSRRQVLAALVIVGALTTTGCAGRAGLPTPGTQQGDSVVDLWRFLFWTATALGAFVLILLGWCIVRYRARGPDDGLLPPQVRGNVPVEALYITVPLLIVAAIFVLSVRARPATAGDGNRQQPTLTVDVTAFQWQWRFDYPGRDVSILGTPDQPPELVLPVGRAVDLRLRSPDVIHSFFVPGFLGKVDVLPGLEQHFRLRPVRPARYSGFCAEFCGLNHSRMNFSVRVVPSAEFDAWVARTAARP